MLVGFSSSIFDRKAGQVVYVEAQRALGGERLYSDK